MLERASIFFTANIYKEKKKSFLSVLLSFLTSLQISSHPLWKCLGKEMGKEMDTSL